MRSLLARPALSSIDRLSLYASTIAFQWICLAVTAWRAWARGLGVAELGITIPDAKQIAFAAVAGAAILGTAHWMNLRRMGRMQPEARGFFQRLAERIFPQSDVEKLVYFALALTAGLCEEFLYRGFTMAALARSGFPVWAVVAASSAIFGLAHLYQGRRGVLATLAFGILFGIARIAYDSLVPVVVWHVTVDAVGGLVGPRYLLRQSNTVSS
ncbi:MAG TPA: CPBP family intramembrane glutamic endopeptidase [Candidatus Acidoferrales bacterium]|nr:CPBP family intramembrane glutamic endopeptidase [Candidatus Acidoferrales bacterium]